MALSPLDIESQTFKREMGGYRRRDVDAFMRNVSDALQHANMEKEELARMLQAARGELDGFRSRERTLMEALASAERLAEERRAMAQAEGDRIISDARRHSEKIIERAREELLRIEQQILRLKVERQTFENRLSSLLDEHQRLLDLRRQESGVAEKLRGRTSAPPPTRPAREEPQAPPPEMES